MKKDPMSEFARTIMLQKYSHTKRNGKKEEWREIVNRVVRNVMGSVDADRDLIKKIKKIIVKRKFIPGGRYLYSAGRPYHQTQNCLLLKAEDSRVGWADLLSKASSSLMTGAGIGVDYSMVRPEGKIVRKTGGYAAGPLSLMHMVNECGRYIMLGGSRRSAIWAGLKWSHADIFKFVTAKNWIPEIRELKKKKFDHPAPLDGTNISVLLDDEFFDAYHDENHPMHTQAYSVYWDAIKRMLKTGEPGFSVNLKENSKETLRNACCEVTSEDSDDICNLGSINLARIESLEEMKEVVELACAFLLAGTVYSDVPYSQVDTIRTKNRRLGLGLMGIHEWLLLRGKPYGPDKDLEEYLKIYAQSTELAKPYAKKFDVTAPIKTRAIAPVGSIGIIGETTTGIEPIFCAAYKRRYLKHKTWCYQYVIDPITRRLVEEHGVDPASIEDAYTLSEDVERRVSFQAWIQQFVDHAISSTINLPQWDTPENNQGNVIEFGNMLLKYLPQLRGITVYPDGARSGQPLTPVKYQTAIKHLGEEVIEQADICEITGKGSCGA